MADIANNFKVGELLELLIDKAMDAWIVSDEANAILLWSRHAETLFGWSADEAIGRLLTELIIPPEHVEAHERGVQRYLQTGTLQVLNQRVEVPGLHRKGHRMQLEIVVTPIHRADKVYFASSIRDISERVARQERLRRQAALLDLSTDAIVVTDWEDVIEYWNAGSQALFGFSPEEALGKRCVELMQARPAGGSDGIHEALLAVGHWEGELVYTTRSGEEVHALSRHVLERGADQQPLRILISNTDMRIQNRLRKSEARRLESEQRFRQFYEHHTDGVVELDLKGWFTSVNQAFVALSGYGREELIESKQSVVAPELQPELRHSLKKALLGEAVVFDTVLVRKDTTRLDVSVIFLPQIEGGEIVSIHGLIKDISHRKASERTIQYLATHDTLTGLANRRLLEDRLQHGIDQAKRQNTMVGVLFLDLNRFKVINDSLGHAQGDQLLVAIARRLRNTVREADTVGRLGGDEFVIVLDNIQQQEDVTNIAGNVYRAVRQPVALGTDTLTVTTSIGASLYPTDGTDVATLLKHADLAMYEAKHHGGTHFRFFDAEMNRRAVERLRNEEALRRALQRQEFVVEYQQRIDVQSGRLSGLEALIRWQDPEKGLVAPADFIPLSEEIGLIHDIGEWILFEACRQNRLWQEAGFAPFKVSVNISARQLASPEFIDTLRRILSETGLEGKWLELEVTETTLMQNIEGSAAVLLAIKQTGVSISIDDFGTGYSSLGYLKKLPIDTLKIDRSFISDLENNPDDATIVAATIALAHNLDLEVIAEGVVNNAQITFLAHHHCDAAQGFFYGQPMAGEEMTHLLGRSAIKPAGAVPFASIPADDHGTIKPSPAPKR